MSTVADLAASGRSVPAWSEGEFAQLVNATLKQMHSVLALARSPLADSSLVTPLLVLDDVSPTADERGQALRLLLHWAVEQLAPARPDYPIGEYRPWDDSTWRDPHWWRYNILRHRYLDPLHPDEFVDGGRYTETLVDLTGIPSTDTYFDERNRAIRDVADWLWQQMRTGQADDELRELALEAAYQPLRAAPEADALLGIAVTFDEVFPRTLLVQMAEAEHLTEIDRALDYLIQHRFLQVGEGAQNLWLSPVLRRYIYRRQRKIDLAARHRRAATYFAAEQLPLTTARHLCAAERDAEAADLLLGAAAELVNELHGDELVAVLDGLSRSQLSAPQWRAVQVLRADLFRQRGLRSEALAACRAALRVTEEPALQASIYRRMGKLYENHNQLHALGYYQQAAERFAEDDAELGELLKDRAWLYILRKEWPQAEADLELALARVPESSMALRADIYDALAAMARYRERYPDAIANARRALALREAAGDLLRVAKSHNNLGLTYNAMGDYHHAILAFREAENAYETLGNRELVAGAHVNIGFALHLDGQLPAAVQAYQACLDICEAIDLPLVAARAHSNLVEALVELGELTAARRHWQLGFALIRQAGFDDEEAYYYQLLEQFPQLQEGLPAAVPVAALQTANQAGQDAANVDAAPSGMAATTDAVPPLPSLELSPDEEAVVILAKTEDKLTPRRLIDELGVSKATATRRLADLVARGILQRFGEGRGTYYAPAQMKLDPAESEPVLPSAAENRPRGELQRDPAPEFDPLYQHRTRLKNIYGLVGLGLSTPARRPQRLVAQFDRPPALDQFFRLEAELAQLLAAEIDLVPATVLEGAPVDADGQASIQRVTWVWQPATFLP